MQNITINNGFYDPEENIDWEEDWEEDWDEEVSWELVHQEMMEDLYKSLEKDSKEMPELDKALGL